MKRFSLEAREIDDCDEQATCKPNSICTGNSIVESIFMSCRDGLSFKSWNDTTVLMLSQRTLFNRECAASNLVLLHQVEFETH
jgi:hypothetical protein